MNISSTLAASPGEYLHSMVASVPLELNLLLRSPDSASQEAAWDELIRHHTRLLLAVARSLGGDPDDAMERYTYVLEKLRENDFRRLRKYNAESGASFSTWLTVAARNLCLDHHRARYGRHRPREDGKQGAIQALRRALNDPQQGEAETDTDTLPDSAPPPDADVVKANRDQCLHDALRQLSPREQLLVSLKFEDGLPASRIARIVGMPSQFHVYRTINLILARLRTALEERGIENSDG